MGFRLSLVHSLTGAPWWLVVFAMLSMRGKGDEAPRVAEARAAQGERVQALCREAGLSYPPSELFLRVFKHEALLECWARGEEGPFRLLHSYSITKSSGEPGPKRREGDRQVPEGFYQVELFNPASSFHLSIRLNYPNASDRVRSDHDHAGQDIYVHGGAASVGCIPLGDDGIEQVYLLALDTAGSGRPIGVHIFPARMSGASWPMWSARFPQHAAFWAELEPGYDAFEQSKLPPRVEVDATGRYVFP